MNKFIFALVLAFALSSPAIAQDAQPQGSDQQQQADTSSQDQPDLAQQVEQARQELSAAIREQDEQVQNDDQSNAANATDEKSRAIFAAKRLEGAAHLRELSLKYNDLQMQLQQQQSQTK